MKRLLSMIVCLCIMSSIVAIAPSVVYASSQADILVEIARKELGAKEREKWSDDIKYNDWYYGKRVSNFDNPNYVGGVSTAKYAWCAVFVSWCAKEAGLSKIIPKFANCSNGYTKTIPNAGGVQHKSKWRGGSYTPKKGDIIFINWDHTSSTSDIHHVGIVYKVTDTKVYYYDGNNTSMSPHGVHDTNKKLDDKDIFGYVTPAYNDSKPSAPTIKSCKATSDTAIKITWSEVSGADKYKIIRTENDGANKKTISNITSESYTDTGLKSNTAYFYTVYAIDGSKTSNASDYYKTYTKPKTPDKPTVTTDSESQMTISWNKVSGATGYKLIYHKAGSSEWKTLEDNIGKNTTSYVHKNLAAGQKYYYRVIATITGKAGPEGKLASQRFESAQSETKTKFTKIKRPSNSLNDDNNLYVDLSWNAIKGDSKYTYEYEVWRDGKKISPSLKETKYTDKTATPGKVHKYQIKIYEYEKGTDYYSYRANSFPFYAAAKQTKEIVLTPQNETTMLIEWDKLVSAPSGTQYVVKRRLPSETEYTTIKTTEGTSYTDKGVKAGTTYYYYVQMRDKDDNYLTSTRAKSVKVDIVPSKVALNKTALTIKEGETVTLTATITPSNSFNKSITWTTSDTSVATVNSSGVVTSKKAGTVDITAKTSNGLKAKCTITVKATACTHSYSEWIVDTNATCESDGTKHRVCNKCSETEKETILATGHSYSDEMQVIKNATCSEEGEKAFVCSVCENQKDNTFIEMTEHSFGEWKQETITSCTSEGIELRTCTACFETETRTTEPKDHTYKLILETEPTLDGPGKRQYICEVCQENHEEDWVHVVSEGIVYVSGVAPIAGETVTIPVSIIENPGIAGFTFKVKYDKNVLTPKEITRGDLTTDGLFTSNLEQGIPAEELEEVVVHWNSDANATDDGTLFNVKFDVSSTASEGQYAIWLEYENGDITNQELDDVIPTVLSNSITIADVLRGDVNLDRIVDLADGIILARFNGGWRLDFSEKQKQAADVYRDSKINSKDGVRLSQLLVGYEVVSDEIESIDAAGEMHLMSETSTVLTVESVEAVAGDTVYIPVNITGNPGVAGFDLKLNYDSTYLTPVSIERGDVLADGDFSTNLDEGENVTDGVITASWSNASNMTEDGTLFFVEFTVSDSAEIGQKFTVTIDDEYVLCDQELNDIDFVSESSIISIMEWKEEYEISEREEINEQSYYLNDVIILQNNEEVDHIPQNGKFDIKIDIESVQEDFIDGKIIIALYDDKEKFIRLQTVDITEEILLTGYASTYIDETTSNITAVKVFVWGNQTDITPLAWCYEL